MRPRIGWRASESTRSARRPRRERRRARALPGRGGSASLIRISPEERSTAVRAAKTMGLNVCGVDILRSNHGPVVMEVNSSPGLEGIEAATGKDIAGMIIDFIEKNMAGGRTKTRGKG